MPLESVVLQIKMLFPRSSLFSIQFLDPPPEAALATALSNLLKHGAVEEVLPTWYAGGGTERGAVGGSGNDCVDAAKREQGDAAGLEQGAFGVWGERTELTQLGRTLALLPVDVHLGKMLVSASWQYCSARLQCCGATWQYHRAQHAVESILWCRLGGCDRAHRCRTLGLRVGSLMLRVLDPTLNPKPYGHRV